MKKGAYIITNGGKHVYQIIGRWGKEIVLAPVSDNDDQVLIYTASELDTLISEGKFNRLHKIDMEKAKGR